MNRLHDERLQFFLRHRDDIRAWAAIETEVSGAVRELLAATQADIEERLAELDPDVTTSRLDNGRWERIMVRRPAWPDAVGVSLEWETGVDPFGGALPKIGVIFLSLTPDLESARLALVELCRGAGGLQAQGYRVPAERVWPVMRRVMKSSDWWHDADAWTSGIVDRVVDLWPQVAPLIDRALTSERASNTAD